MRFSVPSLCWSRPGKVGQANTMVRLADLHHLLILLCAAIGVPATAAPQEPVLTRRAAIRQDAAVYAQQHEIPLTDAVRRLGILVACVLVSVGFVVVFV